MLWFCEGSALEGNSVIAFGSGIFLLRKGDVEKGGSTNLSFIKVAPLCLCVELSPQVMSSYATGTPSRCEINRCMPESKAEDLLGVVHHIGIDISYVHKMRRNR